MTSRSLIAALALIVLAGCSGTLDPDVGKDPKELRRERIGQFGGGFEIGGEQEGGANLGGIAVNGYLWRASLDTMSFFPMSQVDPHGGVIITDWYSLSEAPNERYKATIYILDRSLRADAVRVALFKQVRQGSGGWFDAPTLDGAATSIENAILTRARQLRIDSTAGLQ